MAVSIIFSTILIWIIRITYGLSVVTGATALSSHSAQRKKPLTGCSSERFTWAISIQRPAPIGFAAFGENTLIDSSSGFCEAVGL
jgi:hypothetical protein